MSETIPVGQSEGWSQGDILHFPDGGVDGVELGFIINADCDLANGKHDGVISYLPIYSLGTCLEKFWLPSFLESERSNHLDAACQALGITSSEREELRSWIAAEGTTAVLEKLLSAQAPKRRVRDSVQSKIELLKIFDNECSLMRLVDLSKTKGDPDKFIVEKLAQGSKQLGDSCVYINEIMGFPTLGYVIRMNRILSIEEEKCHKEEAKFLGQDVDPHRALRVAKFSDIFRFKVTQIFGAQYSRVGTDDFFKDAQRIALAELTEELLEGQS